jgi:hypothetical protein
MTFIVYILLCVIKKKYCHVFYLHVATINVDYPDLTRKFIGTMVEIAHNRYYTQFRVW